jgi:ParB-like chromosome segregation protein Spo0J
MVNTNGSVPGMLAIAGLIPHAGNARTHSDAQIEQLAESIRAFGWTAPVLVDSERRIIAGHGRVRAAALLGHDAVPCITLPGEWSEAKRRAYIIADNKLALNADWDFGLLAAELQELDTGEFPLTLTGFSAEELEQIATWTPPTVPEPPSGTEPPKYQVVIDCQDEQGQTEMVERLLAQGIECRARK